MLDYWYSFGAKRMKTSFKFICSSVVVAALSACSGSIDDSFFQADAIAPSVGNVCINGAKIAQNGNEAKETVARLKQFYKGDTATGATVHAGIGFDATCEKFKDKPAANTIITIDYFNNTIIPQTKI
jgi:hypothetical protein